MKPRVRGLSVLLILLGSTGLCILGKGQADGNEYFAPGQAIVEFEPGIIEIPPNPGTKFILLEDVPSNLPGLETQLDSLGIISFEIIGRAWRWIGPEPYPEDHIPPRLISFRDTYVLHFPCEANLIFVLESLESLPGE
jgi:hypothetical protein